MISILKHGVTTAIQGMMTVPDAPNVTRPSQEHTREKVGDIVTNAPKPSATAFSK